MLHYIYVYNMPVSYIHGACITSARNIRNDGTFRVICALRVLHLLCTFALYMLFVCCVCVTHIMHIRYLHVVLTLHICCSFTTPMLCAHSAGAGHTRYRMRIDGMPA